MNSLRFRQFRNDTVAYLASKDGNKQVKYLERN
jgi:hypothetical protein